MVSAQIGFGPNLIIDNSESSYFPEDIILADIDMDGDLDVVTASRIDDKIAWYENLDGQGNFSPQSVISTNARLAQAVEVADFDGDGDLDVVSASEGDNKVAWYENLDGLGNFGSEIIISASEAEAVKLDVGDIDNDGDIDVVVIGDIYNSNNIVWIENTDGLGTFGPRQVISTSSAWGKDIRLSDLDGDNDLDVVIAANPPDKLSWYENTDGMGSFGSEQIISTTANGVNSIFIDDFDGDGDNDILASSNIDDKLAWYENLNGLGAFGTEQIIDTGKGFNESTFGADFDNDGDIDVVAGTHSATTSVIVWYENTNGLGNFGTAQTITDDADRTSAVYPGDIDGDGSVDLGVSTRLGNLFFWLENEDGLGGFGEKKQINFMIQFPECVIAADVDNDGDNDIITASDGDSTITLFRNTDGFGTFERKKEIIGNAIRNVTFVSTIDIDQDGDLDVLAASRFNMSWYKNIDGLGTFELAQDITTVASATSVQGADLDGDGDIDLVSASENDNKIAWYENLDGVGTFGTENIISTNVGNASSVTIADIDNDSNLDVIAGSESDSKIVWFQNLDGLGTFGVETPIVTNGTFDVRNVISTDIDSDGDADILSAEGDVIRWYENQDGLGDFASPVSIVFMDNAMQAYPVDFDNDGDMDVLGVDRFGSVVKWVENVNGAGAFGQEQIINDTLDGGWSVFGADMNGDGAVDALSASRNDGKIIWYENIITTNRLSGTVSVDLNDDGCDELDRNIPYIMIESDNGTNTRATLTQSTGNYNLYLEEGMWNTAVLNPSSNYYTVNPSEHVNSFMGTGNAEIGNFCLEPTGTFNDLVISGYAANEARPGFTTRYYMIYYNQGTTTLNGTLDFNFDETKLTFENASEVPTAITSNSLEFTYENLEPFETRWVLIRLNVFTPPTTQIGDVLTFTGQINPISGDETEHNNSFEFDQVVVGSFDPNDIRVMEGEQILLEQLDDYLHYIIRFQNTGTASAINVRVTNTLDDNHDWTSLQIENSSHTNRVEITNGNEIEFIFNNINLPDSISDPEGSQGYIVYKVKPKPILDIGDSMSNTANIFFDFNPPITTNTVTTTIVESLGISEQRIFEVKLYPNPTNDIVYIIGNSSIIEASIYDVLGNLIEYKTDANGIKSISVKPLQSGIYFVYLTNLNGTKVVKKVIKN